MDDDASTSILGNTLNSIVSGRSMLEELMERKHGIAQETAQPTQQQPSTTQAPETNEELNALRARIAEHDRATGELGGKLSQIEQQNAAMQRWIADSLARQAQPPQQQEPSLEAQIEDPTLLAAINALDSRQAKRFEEFKTSQQQANFHASYNAEAARINEALAAVRAENPEWAAALSDAQINEFVKPHLMNQAQHARVDWKNEFRLAARQFEHPKLANRVTELERELAQYKGKEKRDKESAKRDLNKVPSNIGQRGSAVETNSSQSIGDRIQNAYRAKHGRRASMPWDQFGKTLFAEIAKEG